MIEELIGKTLTSVVRVVRVKEDKRWDEHLIFTADDGRKWRMWHDQDCCESVYIEDIDDSLDKLVGSPILVAEAVENSKDNPIRDDEDSFTWTFYKLATVKGALTIRWYGSSNGYYSESVSFEEIK